MGEGNTILLLERTPLSRDVMALYLSHLARVLVATEPEQAIAFARSSASQLIVVGTGAQGDDELQLCSVLKADPELQRIPILLLCHPGQPRNRERAVRVGAAEILYKPVARRELLAASSRLLFLRAPRPAPRIRLETPVDLRERGAIWSGVVRNLSRNGAYVESGRTVAPGTELQISFPLPDRESAFASKSQVRWVRWQMEEPTGMGLRFLSFDRSSAQVLEHYLDERIAMSPRTALRGAEEETTPWGA